MRAKSPAALFCGAGRITSRAHHPGFSGKSDLHRRCAGQSSISWVAAECYFSVACGFEAGTPNKLKAPTIKQLAQERQLEGELEKQTPLEFALQMMGDKSNPTGFRLECAKAAMAYVHAKKADEPSKEVREIIEIRRVIVDDGSTPDEPGRFFFEI
jgi:hypothetical protein